MATIIQSVGLLLNHPALGKFKNALLLLFLFKGGYSLFRLLKIRGVVGAVRYVFALFMQVLDID
jgi:hypothetical protein